MRLDIRTPLGLLFVVLGLMLLAYGAFTNKSDIYVSSLGINLNLTSGIAMTLFGSVLLIVAYRSHSFRG